MKAIFTTYILMAQSLLGASWYVDNTASGENDGTSWADAWESFASVTWGAAGVVAGDTLYISGGASSKTYTEAWTVGASGRSGSPITIRVGQDAGHSGNVVFDFDSEGDSCTTASVITVNRNYIVFDGSVNGTTRFHIRNLRHTENRSSGNAFYSSSNGNCDNNEFRYINVENCNNGINLRYQENTTIENCTISVRGDSAIALLSGEAAYDNSLVRSNVLTLAYNTNGGENGPSGYAYAGPDGVQGGGMTVEYNLIQVESVDHLTSDQHPDSIQVSGDYVRIVGNRFINVGDSAIDIAYDYTGDASYNNIQIYNNLFEINSDLDDYPEYIRVYGGSCTALADIVIFNNTFADNDSWSSVKFYSLNAAVTVTDCKIINNIWFNCGNGSSFPMLSIQSSTGWTASDWAIQTNVFYRAAGTQYVNVDGANSTVADWVSSNGGSTSSPSFIGTASGNYRLADDDTAAKGQGSNLSAWFTSDILGRTRGSTWDIGAYAYTIQHRVTATTANVGTVRGP